MKTNFISTAILCSLVLTACNSKEKSPLQISEAKPLISQGVPIDSSVVTSENNTVVFISGLDEDSNKYYTKAKAYFALKNFKIVDNIGSLEAIISWLNSNSNTGPYREIHIVSHSNSWRGMSLKNTENGDRITTNSLEQTLRTNGIPKLNPSLLKDTKIIIHSCGLGNNKKLLQSLKSAFNSDASTNLYASPLFNVFGSPYGEHYLAKAYYGYYPTANSPGRVDLSKEFARSYPEVEINWLNALSKRNEEYIGGVYSYKFNIPFEWEIQYAQGEQIPNFKTKDDLMDFIADHEEMGRELYGLKIPIEKFRWKEYKKGNTLVIEGKVTVVCILEPVMNRYNDLQYMKLQLENKLLYEKI
jgi:hypothetical protein